MFIDGRSVENGNDNRCSPPMLGAIILRGGGALLEHFLSDDHLARPSSKKSWIVK